MSRKTYLSQCQGLRALAFLCIFASHLFGINAWGAWGTSVFLVLSGFLMAYNYVDRTEEERFGVKFAHHKMRRLYGLHVLVLAGYVVAGLYVGGEDVRSLLLKTLLHLFLVQTWVPRMRYYYSLNDVSWYLCACVFAYACFGPVVRHLRKLKRMERIVAYLCVIICMQFLVAAFAYLFLDSDATGLFSVHWLTYVCPASRFLEFLAGCCLGRTYVDRGPAGDGHAAALLDATAVCATVMAWAVYTYRIWPLGIQCMKYAFLFLVPSMAMIYAVSGNGFLSRLFRTRILVWIGDLSPYGFLLHGAMINFCRYLLGLIGITGIGAVAACSVSMTFLLSSAWMQMHAHRRTGT